MRLPIRQPKAASILSLPDLAGGLNLRDGANEILDNQLTECENMWWHNGTLKTRPGIKLDNNRRYSFHYFSNPMVNIKNFFNIKNVIGGKVYYLQAVVRSTPTNEQADDIKLSWVNEEDTVLIGESSFSVGSEEDNLKYFIFLQNKTLYLFTNNKRIHKCDITKSDASWEDVTQEEIYVPLVATYCNSNGSIAPKPEEVLGGGTAIEGYNVLSDYYKLQYNAYNPLVDESGSGHPMIYGLLESCYDEKYVGKYVTAKYTDKNGNTYTHKVKITSEPVNVEEEAQEDGLKMRVFAQTVTFLNADTSETAYITNKNNAKNNLEFKAPYIVDDSEKERIFNMTQCEWFGGASAGLSGGTRLFLCGNESEPSLVMWSALNNPLYFPENSYFHVGNDTSRVTGFGKQSDMLVIFKENETWFTRYAQNTNITAQDLINQSVVDYASSAVYFPLIQINSSIGCGFPETIQLCRNRLIWLGSDKKLYTLVSESQYNERNIFCVSEMIEQKIKKSVTTEQLSSCDWNGYYCLCSGDEMYLMDYNCYGYTHISSYSKTEDANIRIPWYYWKFPISYTVAAINDKMLLSYYHDSKPLDESSLSSFVYVGVLLDENTLADDITYKLEADDGTNILIKEQCIEAVLRTKLFDFGLPHIRKNVEQVNIQFANDNNATVEITDFSDLGEKETKLILSVENKNSQFSGLVKSRAIFPRISRTIRFGLKMKSKKPLAVDSIVIKYRTLGGTR